MAKQEITAVQVQMAAAAGVKLLQIDDLPVPMVISKSGAVGILEGILQALASGEVILAPAPPPNPVVAAAVAEAVKPPAEPPAPENNLEDDDVPPIAPVESAEG